MSAFHLAPFNVARFGAPIDAPDSQVFRQALDRALAVASPGFDWRATGIGFDFESPAQDIDPMILADLSVWESAETLAAFSYRSHHGDFVKHRERWFEAPSQANLTRGWIPAGSLPRRTEAFARLEPFNADGPTDHAFDFHNRYPAPTLRDPVT